MKGKRIMVMMITKRRKRGRSEWMDVMNYEDKNGKDDNW